MILSTFIYTIKRELRDKVSMFLMLAFPIILVLIVGTCLRSDFEAPSVEQAKVAIVNLDENEQYFEILKDIFINEKVEKFVILDEDIKTLSEADKKYTDKDIDAYIEIPEGYSKAIMEGDNKDIILTERGENSKEVNIIKQVLNEFTTRLNITDINRETDLSNIFDENMIIVNSINNEHAPMAMDYYGVTLVVLICLYGSLYIVRMISDTLLDETGRRLKTITGKSFKVEIGLLLGSLLVVILQVLLLVGIFKYGYKVYYGENILKVLALFCSLILFSNMLGSFIIKLLRSYNFSYVLLNILILGSTFISGGFVVLDLGDGAFSNIVENFLPNGVCQNAVFSVIYNTNAVNFTSAISTILIETIILLVLSLLLDRRENII